MLVAFVSSCKHQSVLCLSELNFSLVLIRVQDGTFQDRFMEREVLCLVVGCTYQHEGCSWKGMIRNLEVLYFSPLIIIIIIIIIFVVVVVVVINLKSGDV